MAKSDGGPAYPRTEEYYDGSDIPAKIYYSGMTIRDYFAGQYLTTFQIHESHQNTARDVAIKCYTVADAMIKERDNG